MVKRKCCNISTAKCLGFLERADIFYSLMCAVADPLHSPLLVQLTLFSARSSEEVKGTTSALDEFI